MYSTLTPKGLVCVGFTDDGSTSTGASCGREGKPTGGMLRSGAVPPRSPSLIADESVPSAQSSHDKAGPVSDLTIRQASEAKMMTK